MEDYSRICTSYLAALLHCLTAIHCIVRVQGEQQSKIPWPCLPNDGLGAFLSQLFPVLPPSSAVPCSFLPRTPTRTFPIRRPSELKGPFL